MTTENNRDREQAQAAEVQPSDVNTNRRKWLRKAGIAAPAFLVMANRPAMAAGCTISGFMSARVGTSLTTHDASLCNGWSPGNWKNNKGQITNSAWNQAGVSPDGTAFNSVFSTTNLGTIEIYKVVNDVQENTPLTFTSKFANSFLSVIKGDIRVGHSSKTITKHAAAAYLNASFLENGGAGTNPDPWMLTYQSSEEIIALYLMYELTYHPDTDHPSGTSFVLERNGSVYASSTQVFKEDYAAYFDRIADGGASDSWVAP